MCVCVFIIHGSILKMMEDEQLIRISDRKDCDSEVLPLTQELRWLGDSDSSLYINYSK